MIFKVFWKNIEFLEVEKVNDIYYSRLIIENVNKVLDEGKDVTNLIWEIIKYKKDILVYKACNKIELYSEDEKA